MASVDIGVYQQPYQLRAAVLSGSKGLDDPARCPRVAAWGFKDGLFALPSCSNKYGRIVAFLPGARTPFMKLDPFQARHVDCQ